MSFLFLLRSYFLDLTFWLLDNGSMATQSSNPDLASDDLVIEPKKPLNTKRIGELAEAVFLHKAVGLGFRVTKPWGDSERYDFVLDSGTRLWRVQIKCTAVEAGGGIPYSADPFCLWEEQSGLYGGWDWCAGAHVVPLDVWYVVPVEALAAGTSLRLYPNDGCKAARFEKYREAWDLFRGDGGVGERGLDSLEDAIEEPVPECLVMRRVVWKPRFFGR
jgi:hypothetical protein